MPISNYPKGFADGINVRGMPMLNTYPGNVFWVDSGTGSNGNKGTFDRPWATVDYAVGRCTANNGDLVMVKAGHSETFSAAAGWVLDVAGVNFVGLGTGTDRPKIILDTIVSADIDVSAANCGIHNFQFEAGFADIEKMIHLTAANFTIDSCEFREQVATENWVLVLDADGTTDEEISGFTLTNNVVIGADTANENIIKIAADVTNLVMEDNYIELGVLNDDAMIEVLTGKDLRSCRIQRNNFYRLNTQGELLINVDTGTANTGVLANNLVACLDVAAVVLIQTTTRIMQFENYVTGVADESGYLNPAAGADS